MFFVFITFMYSGGLPILYPIASVYFFITYWVDKYLVINTYRQPPLYDATMVEEIVMSFKFAMIFHFVVTYFMYKDP